MANDHFVQRAVIKFWSTVLPNGRFDNLVYVYDFTDGSLERRSTKKVFAKQGLNSPELERRVTQVIDTPLARFAQQDLKHRSGGGPAPAMGEAVWRAVGISSLIQFARFADGSGLTTDSLEKMLSMNDGQLNSVAKLYYDNHTVGTCSLGALVHILLPETGWYFFPAMTVENRIVWAQALPLSPMTVLFSLPGKVAMAANEFTLNSMANFSTFTGDAGKKVVVSAAIVATHGQAEVRKQIPEMRKQAEAIREKVEQIRWLEAEMYLRMGLEPPVSIPGRLDSPS